MRLPLVAILATITALGGAMIRTEPVNYSAGGLQCRGEITYDDSTQGRRPAVIIVHEWWGLNDYPRSRAVQLAQLGYVAFAVDMYGDGKVTSSPAEAGKWAGEVRGNRKLLRERAAAALETIKKNDKVDPNRIAAIGYCFGGTVVLEMARAGDDVKGVVSFHGGLEPGKDVETVTPIKPKVLALNGGADPHATPEQVKALEDEMRTAGADLQVVNYPGAVHGFTNPAAGNDPSKGVAYQEAADKQSWEKMKEFLQRIFAEGSTGSSDRVTTGVRGGASPPQAMGGGSRTETATFAAGCFWGVEAEFRKLPGVLKTTVGYTGGRTKNPGYEDVCSGLTGHAESVEVEYNPKVISYGKLLDIFWKMHDPTTMNRQGPDVGAQYRSAVFFHSTQQQLEAEAKKAQLTASGSYRKPIVTEIVPAGPFYKAEEYHQRYLEKHGFASCHPSLRIGG